MYKIINTSIYNIENTYKLLCIHTYLYITTDYINLIYNQFYSYLKAKNIKFMSLCLYILYISIMGSK